MFLIKPQPAGICIAHRLPLLAPERLPPPMCLRLLLRSLLRRTALLQLLSECTQAVSVPLKRCELFSGIVRSVLPLDLCLPRIPQLLKRRTAL